MQIAVPGISTAVRQLSCTEPFKVWLEQEEEEVERIEDQKRKQKKLEQELAEKIRIIR